MADLTFRKAQIEDAAELTGIAIESKRYWKYPVDWIDEWLPQLSIAEAYILEHHLICALIDSEVVGFYALEFNPQVAHLNHLWVKPLHIGLGVGSQLFRHAEHIIRARGIERIRIVGDPNARAFYEKMGAQITGWEDSSVCGVERTIPILEKVIRFDSMSKTVHSP